MPRHLTTIALGIISGLIIHLYLLSSEGFSYDEMYALGIVGCMIAGILISYLIGIISSRLNEWISWQNNASGRLLIGIFINTIAAFLILYLFYKLNWNNLAKNMTEQEQFSQLAMIKLGIIITVIVIIFSVIYYALFSYNLYVTTHIKESQLQRALVETQMSTLKGQLTPHFLFNSLNTISSLIHRDNQEAESFIRKLAKTYEYTLQNYHKNKVLLEEELDVVHSYIYMMQTRFGDGLTINVQPVHGSENIWVLPLSLQCLVENAVKHNIINKQEPLIINIKYIDAYIVVSNNKTGTPNKVISHQIGLNNLMKRYAMLSGKKLEIIDSADFFTVKIPIL